MSANGVENNPQGITWLSQFLANATTEGYTFDFVAYHWYEGDQSDLLAQTSAMQKLAKQYKIDTVLVTEMGFNDPSTEVGLFHPLHPDSCHHTYIPSYLRDGSQLTIPIPSARTLNG